jgi:hypothetical protein
VVIIFAFLDLEKTISFSDSLLGTLKGILYTTSFYRHFITTGWIGRLFPVKKGLTPFQGRGL